jgi:hypothetical protein
MIGKIPSYIYIILFDNISTLINNRSDIISISVYCYTTYFTTSKTRHILTLTQLSIYDLIFSLDIKNHDIDFVKICLKLKILYTSKLNFILKCYQQICI